MTCPVCNRAPSEAAHAPACGEQCFRGFGASERWNNAAAIASCALAGLALFALSLVVLS